MIESYISLIAIVVLVVVVIRFGMRLGRLEREHRALLSFVLSNAGPTPAAQPAAVHQEQQPITAGVAETPSSDTLLGEKDAEIAEGPPAVLPQPEPAAPTDVSEPETAPLPPEMPRPTGRPDVETALGTRWAVWVGGVALALGGVFLVRYSIEAGWFGPGTRLAMAALFGLLLIAAGEYIRRTGFKVPVEGIASAYVPGILTAAGSFTLFATIYSAYAVYGFIPAGATFVLLGVVALATIAAALIHGQALAGLGLLGSMVTPILVASDSPNPWVLFGYLAVVLVATVAIARTRDWVFLATAALTGTGLWCLIYLVSATTVDFAVVLFIAVVMIATLSFVWLGNLVPSTGAPDPDRLVDGPAVATAIFVAFTALSISNDPVFQEAGGAMPGAILLGLMLVGAIYRPAALALLFGSGLATGLLYLYQGLSGSFAIDIAGDMTFIDGFPSIPTASTLIIPGWVLALLHLAAGLWQAERHAERDNFRAACWAAFGALVPVVVLTSLWVAFGNPGRDLGYAAATFVLALVLAAGGEWIARAESPAKTGGPAVSFVLLGSGIALVSSLHMAFGPAMTTILVAAAAAIPAFATRYRSYPVLGWLAVGAAVIVLGRVAIDPTIVGVFRLQKTLVFNWLLPGYGVPALAFGYAAWQLARTTDGRPRLALEAAAVLFSLLTVAMLVRHAMNGGVIYADAPTLAEQAIYTLIALGAGGILVALDMRSPSSVLRIGSLAAGVVSAALVVLQHFLLLNPLFTEESTGTIPVFNLLFLAYLLPAIGAAALALFAREKRPRWYSAMLALLAAALAFAYASLSLRRLFKGEFIGLWQGMSQLETYSYSALWLVLGVVVLVLGVWQKSQVLRIGSAALIAVAVAKVFLFDMSELEGVLRALSFIGLGAVLIGIGLFYQRLLARAAR